MSRDTPDDFPAVACPAIHYATPDDRQKFDIVQSIRTLTLLREKHPEKQRGGPFHFRTSAEMVAACKGTSRLAAARARNRGTVQFPVSVWQTAVPRLSPAGRFTARVFLHRLVQDGLRRRYRERAARFAPQVEEELNIIAAVGYEAYFLVVGTIVQECRCAASNGSRVARQRTR